MTRFLKSARAIAAVLCIAAACLLPCLAFADEVEAEGPYAILYENGDLVIQDSATPDPAEGAVMKQWDGDDFRYFAPWSSDKKYIKSIVFKTKVLLPDDEGWFSCCENLVEADLRLLDTSQVTDMSSMFYNCTALQHVDLSGFDTSQVTDLSGMFRGCKSLKSVDLSSFDTSNIVSLARMFWDCSSLERIDLSMFANPKVKDVSSLFSGCSSLKEVNLNEFGTSEVLDMSNMFNGCSSLTTIAASTFDTSKVSNMEELFHGCSSLKTLDLSSFNTASLNKLSMAFNNCKSLDFLDLSSFDTRRTQEMSFLFSGCERLKAIKLGKLFAFGSDDYAALPDNYAKDFDHSAKWRRVEGGKPMTSNELIANYDGATMAGTYVWSDIYPRNELRLSGNTALDTMANIVEAGDFEQGGTVVLATFDGYWDALTAAGIAGLAEAPVLMTEPSSLSSQTRSTLAELKPATIIVTGGTAALPDSVVQQAAAAAGNAEVVRCAGKTATGTAVNIYEKAPGATDGTWATTAFVCTNDGYWDALAAAPVSYAKHMPIFLTEGKSKISSETINAMKKGGVKTVYVVGGTAAISKDVETQIANAGIAVAGRLAGQTAVETSEAVAKYGVGKQGMFVDAMGVATTNGYWDALSGAALCGRANSVMVLVDGAKAHSISGFIAEHSGDSIGTFVFGGEAAIDSRTYYSIFSALYNR